MKKGKKIRNMIIVLIVIIVGALAVYRIRHNRLNPAVTVSVTTLTPMTLMNSISTKGTVESVNKRNVYATVNNRVQTINVETGDHVQAGQLLCQLDTEDLLLNIAQQKADLDISQQNSLNTLANNKRLYEEAVSNLRNGTNTQVLNAESNVRTARLNLETAEKNYNDALSDYEAGGAQSVKTAQSNLQSAKSDFDNRLADYVNHKALYDAGIIPLDTLKQLETAMTNAQQKFRDAEQNLANAKTSESRALEQAAASLTSAKTNVSNAEAALNAARLSAEQELNRLQNNVTNAEIATNMDAKLIALQKLERQLADSTVTAPITGTVTAVYAKEGQNASGLMFVIEDTENLIIKTRIKEYDTGMVTPPMPVLIRSDATGDATYKGTLYKISPTAVKNAQGETDVSADVEFAAEVSVDTKDTYLRIGMNTRLTLVAEQKENILCVPYDAISVDSSGGTIVFVASEQDRHTIANALPVTTGMESDFYIEIISDALSAGMRVINDATSITDGMVVRLGD